MGIVFGIAAVVLLIALASKKQEEPKTTAKGLLEAPSQPLPEFVRKVLSQAGRATKDDLLRAAEQAENAGYTKLADALKARASGARKLIHSPWKEITSAAWTRFTRVMAHDNKPTSINPKGFYGMFQMSVRRLVDLGAMANPKSRTVTAPDGKTIRVWEGTWVIPRDKFLSDPQLQYQLFERSMELYRNILAEKYKQVLGLDIEGKPATLSGLLALAHTAGSEGMHKWLTNKNIRRKFHWVTKAYHKANGIF